ncbi:WhiB family transcriptional regulator [Streptomyces sp. DSM 41014]|uniref:Transcriptional regulator WhiB n=1 Tax=Streptomyces hintoniae TaxID=3075521 RepID=A0ABU2USW1_9ACTN|nr:WhiB family transcriptional regulator [Streptomyces sp. DSM 41014]MDT0476218.1 WhiB family transcriptional regulator [Streptomyces sp. DSM 41014]
MTGDLWRERAVCTTVHTGLFHQPNGAAAQAVCGPCPVRPECLYDALASDAPSGVWGGLTRAQRRSLPLLPPGRTHALAVLRDVLDDLDNTPAEPTAPARTAKPKAPRPARKKQTKKAPAAKARRSPEPREDVAELLRAGLSQRQTARRLGVSPAVVVATRNAFQIPRPTGAGYRYSPEQRAAIEGRTLQLLRAGASFDEIRAEVGISAPTILRIRRAAALPPSGRTGRRPARSVEEALLLHITPYGDGHAAWTGPTAGRMPKLYADGRSCNARAAVFEQHHGRPPSGYIRAGCDEQTCIAGAHLTDDVLRSTSPPREKPVTVQARQNLLAEIDADGGPQTARTNSLHHPETEFRMTTASAPAANSSNETSVPSPPTAGLEDLPVDGLLAWADAHTDPDIQDQAARARVLLAALAQRRAADTELAAICDETARLEARLAELRAREAELVPHKPKKKRGQGPASGRAAEIRAWARTAGFDCPAVGRVPKTVVDAWATATEASP